MTYGDKTALIFDNGLFVELARTLAKDFGRVYYHTPWASAFPKSNTLLVGQGIDGVKRVDDFWSVAGDVDLFVFPDVYEGGLQSQLRKSGKRVWGSAYGEELELDRKAAKAHLTGLGLATGKFTPVKGLERLREHLRANDNQWVKVSKSRGDMETFHSKNYKNIEPRLDELEHNLGAKKNTMEFIVEDGIDEAVEVGYDGYTVDGKFPTQAMCGIELKDKGYVGHFQAYSQMPHQIRGINSALEQTLAGYEYRNFFAVEARITEDGTPWIIDPCCRMGSPPGELIQIMYANLADIFWHGADGECIDPIPAGEWGAELLIHSAWADKNWQAVDFPAKYRDNIKFRNLTILDGKYYVVPQSVGLPEIAAVVAVGATQQEAVGRVKEIAGEIDGYFIDVFPEALDEVAEQQEKLKSFGIEI